MKKVIVSLLVVGLCAVAAPVRAAEECTTSTGSYGQTSTTCKVLGETTTVVTHDVVDSGLADISFWTIAQILTMVSIAGFGVAKLAERTYWFD